MCTETSERVSHLLHLFINCLVLSSETKTCVYGLMNLSGHVLRAIVILLIGKK